jgi:triosephosphate isomerase (TIM)
MRKPFVAGNWKMFKTVEEARLLVSELVPLLQPLSGVERVVCPPFTALLSTAALLEGSGIELGAQNMHWEQAGAFTGEIAPSMVAEFCKYVILGHSERRQYFGETDETVNRKVQAALEHGLVPIVCVGETDREYEAGQTQEVVFRQVRDGLRGVSISSGEGLVVAYEPVWAIGTGKASNGPEANAVVADVIRPALGELLGGDLADQIRVLYGGSVKSGNAREFFQQPDIDGALVGGACLIAGEFARIVQAAAE